MSFRIVAEVFERQGRLAEDPRRRVSAWYFRLRARNGEIVAQSEGYHNKQDAIDTARLLAPFVKVVEGN